MSTLSLHRTSPLGCALLGLMVIVLALVAIWSLSQRRPATPVASLPAAPAAPTLTADERAAITTIRVRLDSMANAARKLDRLGQASQADLKWKSQVRGAVLALTDAHATMATRALPSPLAALAKQITETTEQ
jgi:hypothetical protein